MKNFKRWSKFFALALIVCLTLSVLAACGTSSQSGDKSSSSTQAQSTAVDQASKEPKVLTIGMAAAGRTELVPGSNEYCDDNWATKKIIEEFGKPNNIDIKFEILDDTNGSAPQNYQLRMASKNAPDLFFVTTGSISFALNLAANGALADLQPSLDKYGPNIKAYLGEDFIKKYGTMFGTLYTIPGREAVPQISDTWIRKDWLDALGLNMPTNFDEWYAAMKAFKDRAPELQKAGLIANAKDVIPYGSFHMRYFTPWERIVSRFYPTQYFDRTNELYYIYSGYATEYMKEGFKEGFQFINKMYNDGLWSKNFALDSDKKQFHRDIAVGNVGCATEDSFFLGQLSDSNSDYAQLKKNIPQANYQFNIPFTNKYDNQIRNPMYSPVMTYAFVPVYSKVVDQAIQYLNYVTEPKTMITLQYGIEGETYTMDPTFGPILKDADTLTKWGHGLAGRQQIMIATLPEDKWTMMQYSGSRTPEEAAASVEIFKQEGQNGYVRFPDEMQSIPEKALEGALRPIWEKFCVNLITAKPGDFDKVWEAGVKELEANGSTKIIDAKKKEFNLIKASLGK